MTRGPSIRSILFSTGLILSPIALATSNPDSLTAAVTGQWCPTQKQMHLVLLFGYGLTEAHLRGAEQTEMWPFGYMGAFGLGHFGVGGTSCTVKTCPEHPVFNSAIRPPAWKIERSFDLDSLPAEVSFRIPAFETDSSFGSDSLWYFQLHPSASKNEQGCHSLKNQHAETTSSKQVNAP
jgi:hypothetical protein